MVEAASASSVPPHRRGRGCMTPMAQRLTASGARTHGRPQAKLYLQRPLPEQRANYCNHGGSTPTSCSEYKNEAATSRLTDKSVLVSKGIALV